MAHIVPLEMSAPPFTSRFHAIITAKSVDGAPPVITTQHPNVSNYYRTPEEKKRRRDSDAEPGPSDSRKVSRRGSEDEGSSSREPLKVFKDREEFLKALKEKFRQGPHVDFNGAYDTNDSGVTHKQAIQTVAHEIWKTTGYRFTVKDHPQLTNGHKTRFWCSQDDAHRSKSSKAARKGQGDCFKPRVTSAGEAMAKTRFPCRSRLLISARDSNIAGARSITVRMHHHVTHEPYVDATLPPEVVRRIWEGYGWIEPQDTTMAQASETTGETHIHPVQPDMGVDDGDSSDPDPERGGGSHANGYEPIEHGIPPQIHSPSPPQQYIPPNHNIPQPPPPQMPVVNMEYRARMQAHIKNLREFAAGLEYQLQFDDYRMLQMLESEGGSFLELVRDCLQKEGRLEPVGIPQLPVIHDVHQAPHHSHVAVRSMNAQRSYEGNPGINPRALDY